MKKKPQEKKTSGKSQRSSPRVKLKRPLTVRVIRSAVNVPGTVPLGHQMAFLKDIGGGGLLFISDTAIEEGTSLDFGIKLDIIGKTTGFRGKVVRAEKMKGKNLYYIAVSFINTNKKEAEEVTKKIKELYREE